MKARGKREARRPWFMQYELSGLKGRNTYYALSGLQGIEFCYPGATRSASLRASPWLLYLAPLALLSD
jgi:hypothetical protein